MATCETVQLVPGPRGSDGSAGAAGSNGVNAYTTTTANYTQPAAAADVTVSVVNSDWMAIGQTVYVQGTGYYTVQALPASTSATIRNLGYTGSSAAGTNVTFPRTIAPSGIQGAAGSLTGAAGPTFLGGTYPDPSIKDGVVTSAKMTDTGVTAATYGSTTQIPEITVDAAGRITSAINRTPSISSSPTGAAGPTILKDNYPDPGINDGVITSAMLVDTAVAPGGTYGSGSAIPVITVNAKGQITGVSTAAPVFAGSAPTATNAVDNWSGGSAILTGAYANIGGLSYTIPATGTYLLLANIQMEFTLGASPVCQLRFYSTNAAGDVGSTERSFGNNDVGYVGAQIQGLASLTVGDIITVQGKRTATICTATAGSFIAIRLA